MNIRLRFISQTTNPHDIQQRRNLSTLLDESKFLSSSPSIINIRLDKAKTYYLWCVYTSKYLKQFILSGNQGTNVYQSVTVLQVKDGSQCLRWQWDAIPDDDPRWSQSYACGRWLLIILRIACCMLLSRIHLVCYHSQVICFSILKV